MKKLLLLLASFVLVLGLAACNNGGDPDDPDPFTITLAGIEDAEVFVDEVFNVFDGVTVIGSDGVDYSNQVTADSATCDIDDDGVVDTSATRNCVIDYSVVVAGKVKTGSMTLTIKVEVDENAPTVAEWNFDTQAEIDEFNTYNGGATDGAAIYVGNNGEFPVTTSLDQGAIKIELGAVGNPWEPRLEMQGLPLENGEIYTVTFRAKASEAGKPLTLKFGELLAGDPWFIDFKPGQTDEVFLTTDWVEYTYSFIMKIDNLNGGPTFEMGDIGGTGLTGTIWFDWVKITGGSGVDSFDPVISGADDMTYFIEDMPTFDPAAGVTATDETDGDLTADIVISGDTVDTTVAGQYFVTYTVSDAAGNEAEVTRIITIKNDTEAPVLSGVDDATFFLNDGQTELTGVMAMDNRDGDLTADIVLSGDTFDGTMVGTYSVIYTVTDAAGNEASVTREIELMNILFEDYTDNLVNPNFDAGNWHPYWESWNGADAFWSAGENGLTVDIKAVGGDFWHVLLEQEGIVLEANKSYRLSFDASSTVARDIQVEVAGATGITIGGQEFQATVSITETVTTYTVDIVVGDAETGGVFKFLMGNINGAAASVITLDNVKIEELSGTDIVADTNQILDGSFDSYQTLGWGAWSPNGNTSFQTQWREGWLTYEAANANPWENKLEQTGITMVPGLVYRVTFSAKGDAERDFIVGFWDGATAFEKQFALGTDFQTYTWIFTYTGLETAALEFKLGQNTDNFAGTLFVVDTITIEKEIPDTVAPVITLTGGSTVVVIGGTYTPPTCEVTDNLDTHLECVVGGDTVDVNTLGTYVVTYNVTDVAGNVATEVTHTVEVTDVPDTEAPVITLTGGDMEVIQGETYTPPVCTVSDNVDANLVCVVAGDVVDVNTLGTYVVTYNVSDAAGNAATEVTFTVTVVADPLQNDPLNGGEQTIFDTDTVIGFDNTQPWYLQVDWGSPLYSASTTSGVLTIDLAQDGEADFGSNPWDVFIAARNITFVNGVTYRISFDASTSLTGNTANSMLFKVEHPDGWWLAYEDYFVLNENTQTFELQFTWEHGTTTAGKIIFMIGGVEQVLTIENLMIDSDPSAISASPILLGVPEDKNILVGDAFDPAVVTALDPQDGDITGSLDISVLGPNSETVFDNTVEGAWVFTYTSTDADMNETIDSVTITVVGDADAPELSGINDGYVVSGFAWNALMGVSFTDMDTTLTMDDFVVVVKDSTATVVAADANGLYTLANGIYTVEYSLTDANGNAANEVRTISVVDAPVVANNQVVEGDFTGTLTAWGSWAGEGGAYTLDNSSDAMVIDVTNVGGQTWAVQFFQENQIDLVNGKTYAIVFEASSTVDRDIFVELIDGNNQWTASLKDTTQRFVFHFTAGADVTNAKLNFLLGAVNGAGASAITLDNVMVYEVTENVNLVQEGDFTGTLTAWGNWTGEGGVATFDNTSDAMVIDVTAVGGQTWAIQFFQDGINFNAGTMYEISFDASSAVDREIIFEIIDGNNGFWFDLTSTTETFTFNFLATANNANVKINFLLGLVNGAGAGAITIDNVTITEVPVN
jgi:hypothetical protein